MYPLAYNTHFFLQWLIRYKLLIVHVHCYIQLVPSCYFYLTYQMTDHYIMVGASTWLISGFLLSIGMSIGSL